MTEEGDLNLSKEPKEIYTEICMQTSPDEILSKVKETVAEIDEAQDSNDKVSETPTSYNESNHALDLSLEKFRQITLDERDLKTESNLDDLPENSSNMTETEKDCDQLSSSNMDETIKDCDQLSSSNMDETIKDCDQLSSSNMDETIKDCDQLSSSNMDETIKDCDQLGSSKMIETEKDCDQLGSSNVNEIEKDCDQSTGKSDLNENVQSPNKNDAENINSLNNREEKIDGNDGTVQDIDKKVKALKSSNQSPMSPSLRRVRKAGQTPRAKSTPSRAPTSPPITRSKSRELRLQQTPEKFEGKKGNKDESNEEGKVTRGRLRQKK